MNIGIQVKVVHIISEEDIDKQELGYGIDLSNSEIEIYTLYNIDFTKPYDKKMCIVSCSGLEFIVNESYEHLNKRINDHLTINFN